MLPTTRFEITNHCRERYAERVLNGLIRLPDNKVVKYTQLKNGTADPVIKRWLDPIIRKDFMNARAVGPAEKKKILEKWNTKHGKFHDSNIVFVNPFTKTMFVCETKINQMGVFVGRTCFSLQNENCQN
jgi:hypothetical protein